MADGQPIYKPATKFVPLFYSFTRQTQFHRLHKPDNALYKSSMLEAWNLNQSQMRTMRHTTAFVALATAYIGLSGDLFSSTHAASASEELKRAAEYIVSAEQDLAELKVSVLSTSKSLQREVIDADEEADKWEELAKHEGDARMKSVIYAFRDAFQSHNKQLTLIEGQLRDLGLVGEDLELDVNLCHLLQANLEQIVQGKLAPQKARSMVTSTKQGLDILLEKVSASAKMHENTQSVLDKETSALLKYDKQLRQLRAFGGDPKDRIEEWEKQVIDTELDNNTKEAKEVATVSSLEGRMASVLTKIDNATKALQLAAAGR